MIAAVFAAVGLTAAVAALIACTCSMPWPLAILLAVAGIAGAYMSLLLLVEVAILVADGIARWRRRRER